MITPIILHMKGNHNILIYLKDRTMILHNHYYCVSVELWCPCFTCDLFYSRSFTLKYFLSIWLSLCKIKSWRPWNFPRPDGKRWSSTVTNGLHNSNRRLFTSRIRGSQWVSSSPVVILWENSVSNNGIGFKDNLNKRGIL